MQKLRILNNYRVVYMPGHPAAMTSRNWDGWVYEHIVVAEKSLNRRLKRDEHVHHLNGKEWDNRPKNLLVLLASQHAKLHGWLRRGSPGIETFKVHEKVEHKCRRKGCNNITDTKFCCDDCCRRVKHRQSLKRRPSRKQLQKDINNLSWLAIGKKYGVSDNGVRRWARDYGLI